MKCAQNIAWTHWLHKHVVLILLFCKTFKIIHSCWFNNWFSLLYLWYCSSWIMLWTWWISPSSTVKHNWFGYVLVKVLLRLEFWNCGTYYRQIKIYDLSKVEYGVCIERIISFEYCYRKKSICYQIIGLNYCFFKNNILKVSSNVLQAFIRESLLFLVKEVQNGSCQKVLES